MHEDPVALTLGRSEASNTSDWTIRRRFVVQSSLTRSAALPAVVTVADSFVEHPPPIMKNPIKKSLIVLNFASIQHQPLRLIAAIKSF